jgi:WD40 repeat protein
MGQHRTSRARSGKPASVVCAGLLASLVFSGCGCAHKNRGTKPDESDPVVVAARDDGPVLEMAEGVPHSSPIVGVAVDPGGRAALTRDNAGGVRFWPTLDGSRAPSVVPVRDVVGMSLALGDEGMTMTLVDPSGAMRILVGDEAGRVQSRVQVPPSDPVAVAQVLPKGRGVLAIGRDHAIRLLDQEGREVARASERGFRADDLRISENGEVVILTVPNTSEKGTIVEARRLVVSEKALAFAPERIELVTSATPSRQTVVLSPDGKTLVHVHRENGGVAWDVVATQIEDGKVVRVGTENFSGVPPRLILLAKGRVVLDFGSASATEVDLADKVRRPVVLRSHQGLVPDDAVATTASRRVTAHGTWIGVHDLTADRVQFLGFGPLHAQHAALSPSGERIAWANGIHVVLETEAGELREFSPLGESTGIQVVTFASEDELIIGSWDGELARVSWDGVVLDRFDAGGNLHQIALSSTGELLMLRISELFNEPVYVELGAGGFGRRHLVSDGAQHMGTTGSGDSLGVFTVDATGKWRTYTLTELREGIDRKQMVERGKMIAAGRADVVAAHPSGELFTFVNDTTGQSLGTLRRVALDGTTSKEARVHGFIARVEASPDGSKVATLTVSGQSQIVTVFDSTTLAPLFSRSHDSVSDLGWSRNGERVVVVGSQTGTLVLDAKSGEPTIRRCGMRFQSRAAPGMGSQFATRPNVCEI